MSDTSINVNVEPASSISGTEELVAFTPEGVPLSIPLSLVTGYMDEVLEGTSVSQAVQDNRLTAIETDRTLDPARYLKGDGSNFEGSDLEALLTGQYATLAAARIGTGAPNGVVTGAVGDRYIDRSATLGARVWYKATGTGNTGWLVAEGDTGWRTLGPVLENGWTTTDGFARVLIRRVNANVMMVIDGLTGTSATSNVFFTLPVGFRLFATPTGSSTSNEYWSGLNDPTGTPTIRTVRYLRNGHTMEVLGTLAGMTRVACTPSAMTVDAWPSTLPGLAAN